MPRGAGHGGRRRRRRAGTSDAVRRKAGPRRVRPGQPAPKTLRPAPPDPSNGQLMEFMQAMFDRQGKTQRDLIDLISERVQRAEGAIRQVDTRLSDWQDRYDRRLTEMQGNIDNMELAAAGRAYREDAAKMTSIERKMSQHQSQSQPPTSASGSRQDEFLVIIGGFRQEAPREEIQTFWDQNIVPKMRPVWAMDHDELDIPYLLGSVVHLRFSSQLLALRCMSAFRSAALTFQDEGHDEPIKIWATLRKSKEHQAKNRRLMRTAAMFQQYNRLSNGMDTYKLVCWRSACIVVGSRRICRLMPNQTWEFSPSWFIKDVWTKNEAFLRERAINILNDDIAFSAAVP